MLVGWCASTGSIQDINQGSKRENKSSCQKAEMVLTACLLALVFMWTGMAAKSVSPPCDQHMFDSDVDNCLSEFNNSMDTSSYRDSCPWPTVKHIYNQLKFCVDDLAKVSWCKSQTFLEDKVFLGVHQTYFSLCGQVQDPPLTTLIMLITPAIIFTLSLPLLCIHLTT
ncbi:putative receptor activity-modifying protein 1-like isoform 3 [Scophthalmus maximus]|uniref:Putative receptor activity-modifying protein 1-like isoform 3 n=2 Tax=Scophthalmus maximus TaxID=52904 RepID=A0A2U9C9R8_SCOMX|nr:receptor activity-modifying protein 1 isoform X2 [Scophthalmus maximus]AWP12780.1 putative receptor activity-modifying protein 1-like isoform 3 [Scophthalmus maximus]